MPESSDVGRILIVEDDHSMADALASGIEAAGYETLLSRTGENIPFLIHSARPNLILLDLTLPQQSGLEILRQIRMQAIPIRVLILTSHSAVEDRVLGLNAGADDYLGKPFSFPELLARIGSLLRRGEPTAAVPFLRIADLTIDIQARVASRGGAVLELTAREFNLLLYFVENKERTVSREMLARQVWHETSRFTPIDNVINVQIARFRKKLDDPFPVKLLHTIRGVGFILREPEL